MLNPTTNETVKITLTPTQYKLALQYQNSYEQLFNKRISLEDLFKISMFFNLNTNKNKIAILNSYDIDETNKISDKTLTNDKAIETENTKRKIKNYTSPKGSNPELTKKNEQATLWGSV